PYPSELGREIPRLSTSIITVSHDHANHNSVKGFRGSPYVVSGPGEYEVDGVFVFGVATYHDEKNGQERGKNTAYMIQFEDLTICHLGDLGHAPSQEQLEQLDGIDVLLIPVGGKSALNGAQAAEVVSALEPAIAIPMHYRVPGLNAELESEARFLKEMGVDEPERLATLTLTQKPTSEETRVILLEPTQ
ncbi:MAG: MBL fold metallo-hydrolase, partial [Chloroflexi bacterium]|nr:MBL fold metallo-hydrolase [Chloroflexota bacterium]